MNVLIVECNQRFYILLVPYLLLYLYAINLDQVLLNLRKAPEISSPFHNCLIIHKI